MPVDGEAGVLYNSYWIRFGRGGSTFERWMSPTLELGFSLVQEIERTQPHKTLINVRTAFGEQRTGLGRRDHLLLATRTAGNMRRTTISVDHDL